MFGGRFACAASTKGTKANRSRLVMGISLSMRPTSRSPAWQLPAGAVMIQLRKSNEYGPLIARAEERRNSFGVE